MNIESITIFFGWCTLINTGLLIISTVALVALPEPIRKIHGKFFRMKEEALVNRYFHFLATYKILIVVFNLVPYLSLRIMG